MTPPLKVLCFGYPTLNPWDEFLRGAGCHVNSVWFAEDIIPTLSISGYDVAVIGSKVEEGERRQVAKLIKERQPGIAVVFLQEGSNMTATDQADALVDAAEEPRRLLAVIEGLLPRRSFGRAGVGG